MAALPMPCCMDRGGTAPHGHAARLAAHGTRWSFLAAHPGHLILMSTQPAPSLPYHSHPLSASGHGQVMCPEPKQKLNLSLHCHPGKETPGNSRISFSAILRITPHQHGVTKVKSSRSQKGFFILNLFTYFLVPAFSSAFSTVLSSNPMGFELLRL